MAVMTYRIGDATEPKGDGPKIIAHICNDRGVWGAGFVLALSAKSLTPEVHYKIWHKHGVYGNKFKLGNILITPFTGGVRVANMIAQEGFGEDGYPPIRYLYLTNCLLKLQRACAASGESVHMPRIGCGLAGGEWAKVATLVQRFLCDKGVPVFVYDLKSKIKIK